MVRGVVFFFFSLNEKCLRTELNSAWRVLSGCLGGTKTLPVWRVSGFWCRALKGGVTFQTLGAELTSFFRLDESSFELI